MYIFSFFMPPMFVETEKAGKPRGLPPSNWVKFQSPEGELFGLFSYKTINHCDQVSLYGWLFLLQVYVMVVIRMCL